VNGAMRRGWLGWYALAFLLVLSSGVVLYYGALGPSRKLLWSSVGMSVLAVGLTVAGLLGRRR
jgi:hypothetical protein